MRKSITPLLIVTLLFLFSCDKYEKSQVECLMPINTGNSWTYRETYLNNYEEYVDTLILTIGEPVILNGYAGFTTLENRPFNAKFVVGNDEYGNVVSYGGFSEVDTLVKPSIQFKRDANAGESWDYSQVSVSVNSGQFSESIIPIKCVSIDTLISTPQGNFHCIEFEFSRNSGEVRYNYFFSKNVGLIKLDHYEGDNLYSYRELINYQLIP